MIMPFIETRVIPVLQISDFNLVKSYKFSNGRYIGDPLNAVKILYEKECDEICFIDLDASRDRNLNNINFEFLEVLASESFVPCSYGGGINTFEQAMKLFSIGFEKLIFNTASYENEELIREVVNVFGSQSVVASIDVKRNIFGKYKLYSHSGRKKQQISLENQLKSLINLNIGELMIGRIDLEGTMLGYDRKLISYVSSKCPFPVVALHGAGSLQDLKNVVRDTPVSAVAAGSLFMFYGPHKAVLINYPERSTIENLFS